MNVLVDTSVWIDFFAGRENVQVQVLTSLLEEKENICICGIILTEILQGIRNDEDCARTGRLLESLIFLQMSRDTFLQAARMYRRLRGKGITIRNSLDCMIAAVAREYHLPLLQRDRDFVPLAEHCGVVLLTPGKETFKGV